jgi:signal transduction histidine kinase
MVMVDSENKLFLPDDNWSFFATKEQQRIRVLSELGLLQPETIPVFEEATQTAAHFLAAEISILGFIDQEIHWFKSSVGLSRLGLMNDLAQKRQLLRQDSFCSQVVENCQILVINDTTKDPQISTTKLVKNYGIRSYLGVPLVDGSGCCLGALAVMERKPRNFTEQEIAFLQIIARWSMSEFERNRFLQGKPQKNTPPSLANSSISSLPFSQEQVVDLRIAPPLMESVSHFTQQLKLELLEKLTQELRTPLTSVMGMTSVLGREIYGPLTSKQREYLEIIQHSGRALLSLVNEISQLGRLNDTSNLLNLVPVDIEMLCQQAINTLSETAVRREQEIRLSVEPGHHRIWSLDKEKVRQIVYHLLFSMVQLSPTGSIIHVHISYKESKLCIAIWVSHPWLGDGIGDIDPYLHNDSFSGLETSSESEKYNQQPTQDNLVKNWENSANLLEKLPDNLVDDAMDNLTHSSVNLSREKLGLLLSCQLAELHGGEVLIQGSAESGGRYVIYLPLQSANTKNDI